MASPADLRQIASSLGDDSDEYVLGSVAEAMVAPANKATINPAVAALVAPPPAAAGAPAATVAATLAMATGRSPAGDGRSGGGAVESGTTPVAPPPAAAGAPAVAVTATPAMVTGTPPGGDGRSGGGAVESATMTTRFQMQMKMRLQYAEALREAEAHIAGLESELAYSASVYSASLVALQAPPLPPRPKRPLPPKLREAFTAAAHDKF